MTRIAVFLCSVLISASSLAQSVYQPPRFTDSLSRIGKIKATQPVVDRLFREHAEKNHFPGFVYGIVVDGQLLFSGSLGYTDIAKKYRGYFHFCFSHCLHV